jgi:hypothetical protein
MGEGRSAFKILTCTPTEKIPLGRPRRRWEDSIRMDLKEIGIKMRHWVDSVGHGLLESPCDYDIESLGSIMHE